MDKYRYIKSPPTPSEQSRRKKTQQIVPTVLITLGSIIIANVAWPLINHQLFIAPSLKKTDLHWPIPSTQITKLKDTSVPVRSGISPDENTPQVLGAQIDYTNAKTWFPSAPFNEDDNVKEYKISIPSLDIHDAQVIIGGENLNQSLVHYPGTASPGQRGSPVIFGHSILRQFYNPSKENKDRYVSIFSTIMTLKNEDRILVDYDGIRYTYEVKDKVEVQPDDLFILEQHYSNRDLKLITCTPEGTYLRRGVVIASLVDLNDLSRQKQP